MKICLLAFSMAALSGATPENRTTPLLDAPAISPQSDRDPVAAVPEPSSILVLVGTVGILALLRLRR